MTKTQKPTRPLPDTSDPLTAPFWSATRERRLAVPRCAECASRLWPPEPVCPLCLHEEFFWEDIEPAGVLWSYATYLRALDPAFADEIPYTVGLVDLSDDVKMYGIVDVEEGSLEIGMPLEAVFERVDDDVTLVRWRERHARDRS